MPPAGYLRAEGIESCLVYLANTYPSICQLIILPETSAGGQRTSRAIKIAKGSNTYRHGVLFIGGVHARELVNPDLLVSLALKLCQAYTSGSGLTFGGRSYDASTIKLIVEDLEIFIFPLVNPDGRVYVQSRSGDPMWRKNRNPNPGLPCKGVDINRNYDFLWSSTIGASSSSCSELFHGPAAFSEPETRNVRHMLDAYPNIIFMIDLHSYKQLILHPWGDDDNQTTDPSMNFMNPAFNGLRGTKGDTLYKEYIPQTDLNWLVKAGYEMRDAIAAVRGRVYTVKQSVLLYPTSGTSKDYAFSRHFVDASKHKVYAYTLEIGLEFQPPYAEALNIISEVSAGLIQFCLTCLPGSSRFAEASLWALKNTGGYGTVSVDLGRPRRFVAWGTVTMIDSLSDFDRDNAVVIEVYQVDGVETWKAVYGGDHWGPAGASSNVHQGAYVGYGQRITFRVRSLHSDDLDVYGVGTVITLDN
ncbi:MAG: M14 family metallopeptidase [Nitrospiraceae bacterium]|nr:M14 family metallopeptidase [Nitrospiraceae bacterium]